MARPAMRKESYQNALLATVSSLLVLGALEAVVRRLPSTDILLLEPSAIPGLAYTFVPNQDARYGGTRLHINRWGFRDDRDYPKEKEPGLYRIAAVGDSVVFAQGTASGGFARELEGLLDGLGGRKVQVINAGVPSYSTCQELVYLREVLDAFSPDLVIVGYAMNDPEGARAPFGLDLATGRMAPWWRAYHWIKQRFVLVKWASAKVAPAVTRLRGHGYYGPPADPADQVRYLAALHDPKGAYWPKAAECLRGFGEYRRSRGVPVLLVVLPLLHRLDSPELQEMYARIGAAAREAGLETVDGRSIFAGLPPSTVAAVQGDGMHPTDEGHRIIAEALGAALRARPPGH